MFKDRDDSRGGKNAISLAFSVSRGVSNICSRGRELEAYYSNGSLVREGTPSKA